MVAVAVLLLVVGVPLALRRSTRVALDDFVPSRRPGVADRLYPGMLGPDVPWMATGSRSGVLLVEAPGADPSAVHKGRTSLDRTLSPLVSLAKPRWFVVLERTGVFWYLIVVGLAMLVYLAVGFSLLDAFVAGTGTAAVVAAPLAGGLLDYARAQARRRAVPGAQRAADAHADVVRLVQAGNTRLVEAALGRGVDERDLHPLAWRAVARGADGDTAAAEMLALATQPVRL
jgi:hypothetical protein